jgi:hypothetical protein
MVVFILLTLLLLLQVLLLCGAKPGLSTGPTSRSKAAAKSQHNTQTHTQLQLAG